MISLFRAIWLQWWRSSNSCKAVMELGRQPKPLIHLLLRNYKINQTFFFNLALYSLTGVDKFTSNVILIVYTVHLFALFTLPIKGVFSRQANFFIFLKYFRISKILIMILKKEQQNPYYF